MPTDGTKLVASRRRVKRGTERCGILIRNFEARQSCPGKLSPFSDCCGTGKSALCHAPHYNAAMSEDNTKNRLSKALAPKRLEDQRPAVMPSKSTLEEVQKFLKLYTDEVERTPELSRTSKTMYIDFASCFVRWMYGGFKPGSRGRSAHSYRKLRGRSV